MIIGSQSLGEDRFRRHLLAANRKKTKLRRNIVIGLTLTSMVDMFSLLVIFLLQTFSASPELMMVTKGVTLPSAGTSLEIKDAPVLSLSSAGVYLDQKFVGLTDDLLSEPTELMQRLADLRVLWQKTHPKEKFPGEINLQADRELPATIVSRFMAMLPSQHYGSIQLAVVSGGGT